MACHFGVAGIPFLFLVDNLNVVRPLGRLPFGTLELVAEVCWFSMTFKGSSGQARATDVPVRDGRLGYAHSLATTSRACRLDSASTRRRTL